jgi:hypothetical protein
MNAVALSIQLLLAVRDGRDRTVLIHQLAAMTAEQLASDLGQENSRRAFWINCYNAFTQILIKEKSPDLISQIGRMNFFGDDAIVIAGEKLSLNDMEHSMLRHSKVWWSMGHLQKVSVRKFEKQFRVPLDYRIHFALNCGANSCPSIRFYEPDRLNEQLETAITTFLGQDVQFDSSAHSVTISKIFDWYRGDFGGKQGTLHILHERGLIPASKNVSIRYREYDWSVLLHKFDQ